MQNTPIILSAVVAVTAIVAATTALILGHIQSSDFLAIVGAFGGTAVGVGAHAAGVSSQSS